MGTHIYPCFLLERRLPASYIDEAYLRSRLHKVLSGMLYSEFVQFAYPDDRVWVKVLLGAEERAQRVSSELDLLANEIPTALALNDLRAALIEPVPEKSYEGTD